MVQQGFIAERVEFAGFRISLDLAIPFGVIKLGKPPPKLRQFVGRESGDSLLQSLEFTHASEDTTFFFRGRTPLRLTMRREYWASGTFCANHYCDI
jgi:hypothetical protein